MKNIVFLVILICLSFTLKVNTHLQLSEIKVGAFDNIDIQKLDNETKSALNILEANHPELKNAKLIKASQQVVAGINYKFEHSLSNNSVIENYQGIVYRNLQGKFKQTSFIKKKPQQSIQGGKVGGEQKVGAVVPDFKVGGYEVINPQNLDNQAKQARALLQANHPQLKTAKLIKVSKQVVAGLNYKFQYSVSNNGAVDNYQGTIYRNLQGKLKQTGFLKNNSQIKPQIIKIDQKVGATPQPQPISAVTNTQAPKVALPNEQNGVPHINTFTSTVLSGKGGKKFKWVINRSKLPHFFQLVQA